MKVYTPNQKEPYKLSRTQIDFFLECPRCFWMHHRRGVRRPSLPGFSLNSAVDELLKKEFDLLRKKGQAHEIMKQYKINAVPYAHPDIDTWRSNFIGKQYHHQGTNFIITGAVDDLWINPKGELIIVDYKSTSTEKEISLEDQWKQGYKKQLEIYSWIFEQSGFIVSKTTYIVYANAAKNLPKFDGKLDFKLTLHPHKVNTSWIESALFNIKNTLQSNKVPPVTPDCEHCTFANNYKKALI